MGSSGGSLRDLYSEPPTGWSFIPPENNGSTTRPGGPLPVAESAPSYQWSARPRTNSIYELSPDLNFEPSAPNAIAILRAVAASVILQYCGAAIENPWEVGKTLLQVQYVPRNAVAVDDMEPPEEEEASDDTSSADNEDNYFADEAEAESSSRMNTPRPTDDRGYVVRQNVSDNATRPDWVLPPGTVSGVWGMVKEVSRWKPEGWLALWKGTATGCVKSFLEASLQPLIHSALTQLLSTITLSDSPLSFARAHPLLLPVASTALTGVLLSPLDLIRTRLIVQTSVARHRRYTGPFHALSHILTHEGGFHSLFLHPQLLFPALLEYTVTPFVSATAPVLVARLLGGVSGTYVTEDTTPLLWGVAKLAGACAGLLVTLPVVTIRRRLQVQTRGSASPIPACVEIRRRPYAGIVDTLYSVITEERSDLPLRPRKHARRASRAQEKGKAREDAVLAEEANEQGGWFSNTGVMQLYRGFRMSAGASALIFVMSIIANEPNEGSGWTEL